MPNPKKWSKQFGLAGFALLLWMGVFPSMAEPVSAEKRKIVVDGLALELTGCTLKIAGGEERELDLPGECQFSVDANDVPEYRETPFGACVIVMSITPIPGGKDCDVYYLGILIQNGEVRVASDRQHVAMCDDGPLDEKVFAIYAHQIEKQAK